MDTNCAWCSEPWEVQGLRHEGWEYITGSQAAELNITDAYLLADDGNKDAQRSVSETVYVAVLSGKGCPETECGFDHGEGEGPHRDEQYQQLVFDGITDDDPMTFI